MSKQQDIEAYINTIVGTTVSAASLCLACKCTLPTVYTYIKNNSHRFQKVSRGNYAILPLQISTSAADTSDNQSFDW